MNVTKHEWVELWKILGEDFWIEADNDHPCANGDDELPDVFDIDGAYLSRTDHNKPLTAEQKQIIGKSDSAVSIMKNFRKIQSHETLVITFPKTERDAVIAALNTTKAKIVK